MRVLSHRLPAGEAEAGEVLLGRDGHVGVLDRAALTVVLPDRFVDLVGEQLRDLSRRVDREDGDCVGGARAAGAGPQARERAFGGDQDVERVPPLGDAGERAVADHPVPHRRVPAEGPQRRGRARGGPEGLSVVVDLRSLGRGASDHVDIPHVTQLLQRAKRDGNDRGRRLLRRVLVPDGDIRE